MSPVVARRSTAEDASMLPGETLLAHGGTLAGSPEHGAASRTIAWPGAEHVLWTLARSLRVTALFVLVYGGADAVTRLHGYRLDLSTGIDSVLPFVPEATLLYSSLYVMFALVPLILRARQDVRRLERVMSLEILIAAPFFIALPLSPLAVPDDLGAFDGAFRFADLINLNHNLFPSLHATFGFTVGAMLGSRCGRRGRLLFAAWAAGIALSTLLTRQHLVLDVAGALGLTWWALRRLPEVQS